MTKQINKIVLAYSGGLDTSVMLHWLRRGIDGWRLDAAYAIPLPALRSISGLLRTSAGSIAIAGAH